MFKKIIAFVCSLVLLSLSSSMQCFAEQTTQISSVELATDYVKADDDIVDLSSIVVIAPKNVNDVL